MRVAILCESEWSGTTAVYWARALQALGVSCDRWLLRDLPRVPAEYALYVRVDHGDDYEVRLPAALQPSVFYAIDTHLPHSWRKIRRAAGWYDLTVYCHLEAAERMGGAWIPVGCDPELHGAVPGERAYDVAFVGTDGRVPRKFLLQALRERYPRSAIGAAPPERLAAIYSRARVGFNYAINNDVNMRAFEVMAAGALLVTNPVRPDGFQRLGLEGGRHLRFYRNPRELFEVIDEAVAMPAAAQRIAEAGRQLVLARHTYAHRIQQVLALVEERLGVRIPHQTGALVT